MVAGTGKERSGGRIGFVAHRNDLKSDLQWYVLSGDHHTIGGPPACRIHSWHCACCWMQHGISLSVTCLGDDASHRRVSGRVEGLFEITALTGASVSPMGRNMPTVEYPPVPDTTKGYRPRSVARRPIPWLTGAP